ncbi:MAG: DUF541 domain-containing protein [Chlorobi bacterium CHB2]|nr:DUF541 domain-containing protein [Chlorobi bacterium CHB2]
MKPLLFVPLLLLVFAAPAFPQSPDEPSQKTIYVTGMAEAVVEPDEASFLVLIQTKDVNIDSALGKNAKIWGKFLDLIQEMAIPSSLIQSDRVDIEPEYLGKTPEYSIARGKSSYKEEDEPTVHEYSVERRVAVTLKDLNRYTEMLAKILKLDLKISTNPIIRLSTIDAKREELRLAAIRNAKERAVSLAAEIGAGVGDAVYIRERDGAGGYDEEDYASIAALRSGDMASASRSITPGKLTVRYAVTVVFELVKK